MQSEQLQDRFSLPKTLSGRKYSTEKMWGRSFCFHSHGRSRHLNIVCSDQPLRSQGGKVAKEYWHPDSDTRQLASTESL